MAYYQQDSTPARPHRGCLIGALAGVGALIVILGAVIGYGAWYFHQGFDKDPRVKAVLSAAAQNDEAVRLLGKNIKVLELEHYAYGFESGKGSSATYVVKVAGSAGSGELKADLDVSGKTPVVRRLTLVSEDGQAHYLIGDGPPNPFLQNSI